ncbi:MAG: tetratricopeptide repeat protein [Candidatus Wallbacteria bacterium]|nr:tetratricopeptide repeat protein [Candidatus Wallbacteria bacterium]
MTVETDFLLKNSSLGDAEPSSTGSEFKAWSVRILCLLLFVLLPFSPVASQEEYDEEDSEAVEVYEVTEPDEVTDYGNTGFEEAGYENAGSHDQLEYQDETSRSRNQIFSIQEHFNRAEEFFKSNALDLAVKEYKAILRKDRKHSDAYRKLGEIYEKQQDYERSSSTYKLLYSQEATKSNLELLKNSRKLFINQLKSFSLQHPQEAMIPAKIAEILYEDGDIDNAVKYCREAINVNKDIAKAYHILALIQNDKQSYSEAYENISVAFRLEPESQEYFQLLNKISRLKESKDKSLKQEEESKSSLDSVYYTQALKHIENRQYDLALDQLQKMLEQYPNNMEISTKIAELKRLKQEVSNALYDFRQGEKYFREEKYDKSLVKFSALLEEGRDKLLDFLEFNHLLLLTYFHLEKWKECLQTSLKMLEQVPMSVEAYYYGGIAAEKNGDKAKALELFIKCSELEGELIKFPEIRRDLKSRLFFHRLKKNSWKIALAFFFLVITTGLAIYSYNLGPFRKKRLFKKLAAAHEVRKYSEIQELVRRLEGMPLSPSESRLLNSIWAESNFQQNNFDKALLALKSVIKVDPDDQQAHTLMAKIFLKKESTSEESLYEYARLVKKEPGNPELIRLIVRYLNSTPLRQAEKWQKAFAADLPQMLETAYRLDPNNQEVLHLWTVLALRDKKSDEKSREVFARYLEFSPDEKLALEIKPILLKGYYSSQKYEKAINLGVELLETLPKDPEIYMILSDICEHEEKSAWLLAQIEKLANKYQGRPVYNDYISQLREKIRTRENKIVDATEQKAGELSSEEVKNLFEEGKLLFKNGELNQSIAYFRKCFKTTDDTFMHQRSSKLLILSYLRKGLFDLAKEQYKITGYDEQVMSPDIKELCYMMGEAFEKAGMYQDAIIFYDKVCRIDVGYRDSFDRFERLRSYLEKNENS